MPKNNAELITELWEKTISQIKTSLPETEFVSWFSRLSFGSEDNGKITLYTPSVFVKDKFEETYKTLIENTISEIGDKLYSVKFEVKKGTQNPISTEKNQESVQDKPSLEKSPKKLTKAEDIMFNPAYTFDSFVSGDNSSFAYNACLAIAKNPGSMYNPCLLYGGVGLGKTHLIQSIGNYIRENTKMKVIYITAENFTNEFIQAVNDKSTQQQFKNKYRRAEVLLIDDIHFLQKKEGTQEELFNTFNDLYDTGRQIVFTCDRPVEELKDISDRLRSRFSRGLNIDLLPPNYETRVAILKKKCEEKNVLFSNDVIEYIATNISSNVRDLESCLTKLIAYSDLVNKNVSLEVAKEQLKNIVSRNNDSTGVSIELVIKTVASYFNVSPFDIKGKSRNQSVVIPRQIAMYLCKNLTDFSTTEIGMEFGGKNHTTVMYNVQKVESLLRSSEKDMNLTIDKLKRQIKADSKK